MAETMAVQRAHPLIVVGLGNPTTRYERTRHNIGFRVLDVLSTGCVWDERFSGLTCKTSLAELAIDSDAEREIWLLKPQTYMNASGLSVRALLRSVGVDPSHLLVIHDELDLPLGKVRLKWGGREAGHNGLRSLSRELGTRDYCRLRVGIGRPAKEFVGQLADYVLQTFPPAEEALLDDLVQEASTAIRLVLKVGFSDVGLDQVGFNQASNAINRR